MRSNKHRKDENFVNHAGSNYGATGLDDMTDLEELYVGSYWNFNV